MGYSVLIRDLDVSEVFPFLDRWILETVCLLPTLSPDYFSCPFSYILDCLSSSITTLQVSFNVTHLCLYTMDLVAVK